MSEERAFELHRDILGDWVILEYFEEGLDISTFVVRRRRGHGLFDTHLEPDLYVSDMPNTSPPVHVIVRLPYNRPENAVDPPVVGTSSSLRRRIREIDLLPGRMVGRKGGILMGYNISIERPRRKRYRLFVPHLKA